MNAQPPVIIGLETHLQLKTKTKLFCPCESALPDDTPNSKTCPVCLGHPGAKPFLNAHALNHALKLSIALGCDVSPEIFFSRKTYFYPDMSKNFQITQYEVPLGRNGLIQLKSGKKIRIERIHLEEDPASLIHEEQTGLVLIDYNRSGNPLAEIVTTPCISSPAEARDYLKELLRIVTYLDIFDDAQCILKADANISLSGHPRVEIKNISGFKDIERALNYEIVRQRMRLKKGETIVQETRRFDTATNTTRTMRTKESEEDYGYIFDADLAAQEITTETITKIKASIPELAHFRINRIVQEYGIDMIDAEVICSEKELADLFERIAKKINPKLAAFWLRRELLRVLNYASKTLHTIPFGDHELIELLTLLEKNTITQQTGQRIIEKLVEERFSPKEYVEKNNLLQVTSENELRILCKQIIGENKKAVEDYSSGQAKAVQFLIGCIMKATHGKANPEKTRKILEEEIKSR